MRSMRGSDGVRIGVLNGPNLNLLGKREPEHYGHCTLSEIESQLRDRASDASRDVKIVFFQSNEEAALVDWVQQMAPSLDGFLVNAAAFTHTSVALRDALAGARRPFVELHLSNVHAREPFRRRSVIADLAVGVVAGFRENSYLLALDGLLDYLASADRS